MSAKADAELSDEDEAQWAHHAARASAFEEAAGMLMEKAKVRFGVGRDDIAVEFRDVASELKAEGRLERQKQESIRPVKR